MCGIEQHAWVTTASTNDVPLGARYDFDWTKSSNGKFTYSDCSYNGKTMKSVEEYSTADKAVRYAPRRQTVMYSPGGEVNVTCIRIQLNRYLR